MPAVQRRFRPRLKKHPVALYPNQWLQIQAYAEEHHEGVTARAVRALIGEALEARAMPEGDQATASEAA